jgi:hypothetical protein
VLCKTAGLQVRSVFHHSGRSRHHAAKQLMDYSSRL